MEQQYVEKRAQIEKAMEILNFKLEQMDSLQQQEKENHVFVEMAEFVLIEIQEVNCFLAAEDALRGCKSRLN